MGKTEVKFWLNQNVLHVKNEATNEVKTIEDEKQIALFLNEHLLTANEVQDLMYGYDVLGLFDKQGLPGVSRRGTK